MRPTRCPVILGAALSLSLLSGCLPFFPKKDDVKVPTKATAPSLVRYLNEQSGLITSVEARLAADASQNGRAIGIDGNMACEKPRGFRLRAKAFGSDAVDIGSNNDEFWFWVKEGTPANQYHCSYRDLASGKVNVPFPFQPDMVLVALGMATYDPEGRYELKDNPDNLELVVDTKAPDGKPVKRSVLFRRKLARPGEPQVVGHVIRDGSGKVLCEAKVTSIHVDRESGASVPSRVEIKWPSEKASMTLMLSGVRVNAMTKEQAAGLFTRQPIPGVRSFDLATGRPDGASTSSRASR